MFEIIIYSRNNSALIFHWRLKNNGLLSSVSKDFEATSKELTEYPEKSFIPKIGDLSILKYFFKKILFRIVISLFFLAQFIAQKKFFLWDVTKLFRYSMGVKWKEIKWKFETWLFLGLKTTNWTIFSKFNSTFFAFFATFNWTSHQNLDE